MNTIANLNIKYGKLTLISISSSGQWSQNEKYTTALHSRIEIYKIINTFEWFGRFSLEADSFFKRLVHLNRRRYCTMIIFWTRHSSRINLHFTYIEAAVELTEYMYMLLWLNRYLYHMHELHIVHCMYLSVSLHKTYYIHVPAVQQRDSRS